MLDLGAGTGKLTRALVALGHEVIAVEPSTEMIGRLRRALPGVEAIKGAAEQIPVPDGSIDVVTAGQAFHWFDADVALPEIVRVLRRGGSLGLVWNLWHDDSSLVKALSALLPPAAFVEEPTEPVARSSLFGDLDEASFDWVRPCDRDELVTGVATQSSVATLPPDERSARLEAVGRVWDEQAEDGILAVPYRTSVYRATRL